jgi:hypothetical protein
MDHEGTPITFRIDRVRRNPDDYGKSLNDRQPNLGVFITGVKISGEYEKAKVWSPKSTSVHTVSLETVKDFHNAPLNLESMVVHDWQALVKTLPAEMIIDEDFVLRQCNGVELRSKLAILTTKPPCEWPVTGDGDSNFCGMEEVTKDWPLNRCYLDMEDQSKVRYGNVVLDICSEPELHMQTVKLKRGRKKKDETDRWLLYDPALGDRPWQKDTVDRITKMMKAYEAMKELGAVK